MTPHGSPGKAPGLRHIAAYPVPQNLLLPELRGPQTLTQQTAQADDMLKTGKRAFSRTAVLETYVP